VAPVPPPIPADPLTPPGPDWKWKGPPYDPTGNKPCGGWVGPEGDKLHPDLVHRRASGRTGAGPISGATAGIGFLTREHGNPKRTIIQISRNRSFPLGRL
jgi:hypothetical protein